MHKKRSSVCRITNKAELPIYLHVVCRVQNRTFVKAYSRQPKKKEETRSIIIVSPAGIVKCRVNRGDELIFFFFTVRCGQARRISLRELLREWASAANQRGKIEFSRETRDVYFYTNRRALEVLKLRIDWWIMTDEKRSECFESQEFLFLSAAGRIIDGSLCWIVLCCEICSAI